MHTQLGNIEIKHGVSVDQFFSEGIISSDLIDLFSGIFRHIRHLMKDLSAPQCQIPSGDIQTGHQQVASRRRLCQINDLAYITRMNIRSGQKKAGLCQASSALVHGYRCHIRPCRHGRYRQSSSEIEMRSVRLICQTEHPGIMRHFYDGPQIAADSVIGRIVDQYRYRLRMLRDCLCHLLSLHSQRNSQPLVHLRIYIDRNCPAQYQCIQHTAVYITWQDDLIPPFAGSQHHTLYRAGSASHHKKSMCRSKCICCQFFRFPDDGYRVAQIV